MNKLFNMGKGGILISQTVLTLLNYIMWAVVLKPLGIADSVTSANHALGGMATATQASSVGWGYVIAKTFVYMVTTGLFIGLIAYKGAYKKLSMGTAVLACSGIALASDFLNMTILPSFVFYSLTFVLILASKEEGAVAAAPPASSKAA